jgi:hypothetical protein
MDTYFQGYYQTKKYTVQRRGSSGLETVVVGPMAIKSEIIRPRAGEVLGVGTTRLFGVAWAGEEVVAAVEVSTNGGRSWTSANRIGPRAAYSWTLWEYYWEVAEAGDYALLARAISVHGEVQPLEHDPLCGGYMIHFSRPTFVRVAADRSTTAQPSDAETIVYDMNAYAEENRRFPLDVAMEFALGGGI